MTTDANTDESGVAEDVTTAADVESTAEEATRVASESPSRPRQGGSRSVLGVLRNWLVAILLAVALLASAGVAAGLYYFQYRPDQQTNADAANVALEAAKSGTAALLSYSPETLDADFAAAKANLTGDFLNYYTEFTEQIVTPAAKQKSVKTSASVVRAAVSEIHPDSAVVLVFVNQVTVSKENPDGAFAASAVKVGLKKIDARWLISSFDPV